MPFQHLAATVVAAWTPSLFAGVASAWNGTGHEVVAHVAWDQLTPPLPVGYEKQAHATADAQAARAGHRLANLLAILPESQD